ncbi:hypothetical protein L8V23_10100 [Corynebacterium sp. c6VSa_13]|uniref:hypothetical protein n=1 Tax=Corynebacterium sp. c6VSa_13 TaxID=2913496 RepID=UPI0022BA5507|nr:hypothetical protein [Corynebacterium sp. c6VSa_13]MCZ9310104.1 hypothetical protein [Corynebacterium sp. c6VSa_13]
MSYTQVSTIQEIADINREEWKRVKAKARFLQSGGLLINWDKRFHTVAIPLILGGAFVVSFLVFLVLTFVYHQKYDLGSLARNALFISSLCLLYLCATLLLWRPIVLFRLLKKEKAALADEQPVPADDVARLGMGLLIRNLRSQMSGFWLEFLLGVMIIMVLLLDIGSWIWFSNNRAAIAVVYLLPIISTGIAFHIAAGRYIISDSKLKRETAYYNIFVAIAGNNWPHVLEGLISDNNCQGIGAESE